MCLLNCVVAVVLAFVLCTGAFGGNIASARPVPDVAAVGGASGVSASSTLDATIDVFWASVPFSLQSEGAESGLSPGLAPFIKQPNFCTTIRQTETNELNTNRELLGLRPWWPIDDNRPSSC